MRNQRRSSSPILIVLIPIAALVFFFIAIPPVVSFASTIFRPLAFRNGWNFLNIFLVLFAVLCGVFANRNDDEPDSTASGDASATEAVAVASCGTESSSDNPQRWFGFTEGYPGDRTPANNGVRRLRRSSSSYPDLRHDSLWNDRDDYQQRSQVRFFDDFEVEKHRQTTPFHSPPRRENPPEEKMKVNTTVDKSPPTAPPPPPPPPPSGHRKPRRREKRAEKQSGDAKFVQSPSPPPPPPPPLRPPDSPARIPKKLGRRKSNVKKEIATALASLYNQRKRKRKQIITSGASSSNVIDSPAQFRFPPPSPPPPPPPLPPPPSSVFNNLFKKGTNKTKRIHSVPPPLPPPSPLSKHEIRSKISPPEPPTPPPPRSRQKPPLPAKPKFYDENASSGNQSPLIPIPPPPPFKVAEWRFDVSGDFVRLLSAQSSRCGSPELDDPDSSSGKSGVVMDGGDGARGGLVLCPSPDVNLKADNFIARLYDGWRLEKIKSLRENQKM